MLEFAINTGKQFFLTNLNDVIILNILPTSLCLKSSLLEDSQGTAVDVDISAHSSEEMERMMRLKSKAIVVPHNSTEELVYSESAVNNKTDDRMFENIAEFK